MLSSDSLLFLYFAMSEGGRESGKEEGGRTLSINVLPKFLLNSLQ